MGDDDPSERGLFATIWARHCGSWWFRIGLGAVVAAAPLTAFLRGAGRNPGAGVSLALCAVAILVAIILINQGDGDQEALNSEPVPRIRGEAFPIAVRFRTPGIGPFGRGEGDIRFLPGTVRFVNWRRDPWDVLVAIALGLLVAGMAVWGWIGVLILLGLLPRRRAVVEDVPAGEVKGVEVGEDRVVLTTHNVEPFARVVFSAKPLASRRLVAMLLVYCPDARITAGGGLVRLPVVPTLDERFVLSRALSDTA